MTVPARSGVHWIQRGLRTFLRQPLAFVLLLALTTAFSVLLLTIPLVGLALSFALPPLVTLMLMAATARADQGQASTRVLLRLAVRAACARPLAMLLLGAIYATICAAAVLLSTLVSNTLLAQLLALPLLAVQMLMFWHASGLVYWHGVPPLQALFLSATACLRNWRAFALFSLTGLLFLLVCCLAVVPVLGLLVPPAQVAVMCLAMLVPTVTLCTSVMFSFRDCFPAPR